MPVTDIATIDESRNGRGGNVAHGSPTTQHGISLSLYHDTQSVQRRSARCIVKAKKRAKSHFLLSKLFRFEEKFLIFMLCSLFGEKSGLLKDLKTLMQNSVSVISIHFVHF